MSTPAASTGSSSIKGNAPDKPCSMCTPTYWAQSPAMMVSRKAPLATSEPAGTNSGELAHEELSVDGIAMVRLLGPQDRLLKTVERQFPLVRVHVRGNEISLDGEATQVADAKRLVDELVQFVRDGSELGEPDVTASARMLKEDPARSPSELLSQAIVTSRGKAIRAKTM